MQKKIDKLLIISFIPPFLVSFIVALFVLVIQTLWLYLDEIAGKGVSLINILEMLLYLSVALVPKALPIGILVSSVMVFGGLAERYELSSLKSAGVSLLRVMRPAIGFSVFVALFSLFCSEYLNPVANLKFISRLHDIRKKKSTLSLEAGVFNYDFGNMVIYIGGKSPNQRNISDIKIYDQSNSNAQNKINLVTAQSGEMYPSENGSHFIMKLFDGYQYEELQANKRSKYPFTVSKFDEWTKVFDMSVFDLSPSDNDLFKTHQATMTTIELITAVDSLNFQLGVEINKLYYDYSDIVDIPQDTQFISSGDDRFDDRIYIEKYGSKIDSIKNKKRKDKKIDLASINFRELMKRDSLLTGISSISALIPNDVYKNTMTKAQKRANSYFKRSGANMLSIDHIKKRKVRHIFELHSKLAFALVCIFFMFIGAPMGAIVRKGGFGYPLLVSVIFFVIYILMSTSLRRICEAGDMNAVIAAWIPNLFTIIIGGILTYRALNDFKFTWNLANVGSIFNNGR